MLDAISGRDDPTLETLSPDDKLLRVFDLAAGAIRALAATQPVALFVDDLQWADEDSVRHAPLRRPHRLRPADLPRTATRTEKLAEMTRSRHADRGHGANGPGAAPQARALLAARVGGARPAGPWRQGQRLERGDDARAGRRSRVHRRGARPDVSRDRDDPGDRRERGRSRETPPACSRPACAR